MLSLWTYSYSKFVIKIPKQNHEDILSASLLLTQRHSLSIFIVNSELTIKILRECLHDFVLVSLLQTLSKNMSIGTTFYY